MEPIEQLEIIEPKPKKSFKNFWKGALCGALSMLLICVLVGILLFFTLLHKGFGANGNEGGIVSIETQNKLQMIRQLIEQNYLYSDDIDENALQDSILKGYVNGLNEPYSVYYNEAETTSLFESTTGTFGGIGVVIMQDRTSGLITFTNIYDDAPGQKAGFKAGDIVYKVNGEDITGMDLDSVVSKIRGAVGTKVEITVIRGDKKEEYTGTATRALIENNTVAYEMKEGKLGYIQISGFEDVTFDQFKNALTELKKQKMKGLVIDLRSNPGGNLQTVCQMADLILPKGNIVSIKDKNGNGNVYTSDADTMLDVPLVVLINGYSASASEIFAGAVQDYKLGTLVGTTTYGKGIVQNIYGLGDGTALKITSSEYFTANGRNIHGIGIKPDVELEYQYNENDPNADNQLEKAIEILKKGM
jgi:carboxyl-terminal processing protease